MPLNPQILIDGFRAISDTEYSGFEGFPQTIAESSQRYADVMVDYISGMFPPTNGQIPAEAAFIAEHSQTTLQLQDGLSRFTQALTDFAFVVNNSLPFYSSVPPIGIVDLSDFNTLGTNSTAEFMANELATRIDTWIRTGVATPLSGGGPPISWS